jgi:hypothetical protein
MAFNRANFAPMGNESKGLPTVATGLPSPGGPRMWCYATQDAIATVAAADYFVSIRDLLQIGDLIYVAVYSAGALSTASLVVVKDKTATSVDTTDATALTVTDAG